MLRGRRPTQKQALFLLHDDVREVMYGGAAGGGKTDALLMAALQYAHVPGYAALFIMRTFSDLSLPNAGMQRARDWLAGTGSRPVDGGRSWVFPSGASLTFGHMDKVGDEEKYRTAEFQFIAFDELTRFPEGQYRFLFSRLRRIKGMDVPLRVRSGTNPGGKGHEWVKKRFLPPAFLTEKGEAKYRRTWWNGKRLFVPARLEDNAHLDADDYEKSLDKLLPVDRDRLRKGDWSAHQGGHFQEEWLQSFVEQEDCYWIPSLGEVAKKWDCAIIVAVDPAGGISEDADYTAIVVCALTPAGTLLVLEVVRERLGVEGVVPRLAETCMRRRPLWVAIESDFAQSAYIREARRTEGIPTVNPITTGGRSKLVRATPMILRGKARRICLPRDREAHRWCEPFVSELCAFTGDERLDAHDDQVDALSHLVLAVDNFGLGRDDDGPAIHRRTRG